MNIFEKEFLHVLSDSNSAGAGGAFGDGESMGHGGAIGMTDFYATGDNRLPLGGKKKKRKKKGKDKNKRDGGISPLLPTQRRPLSRVM
jgi:hypothetical protein